jgi:hypothetical protein
VAGDKLPAGLVAVVVIAVVMVVVVVVWAEE